MIAASKPTCPHCGATLHEQSTESNAAFDYTHSSFDCGTVRQAYAESGELFCETRSGACKAATGTIDQPQRARHGGTSTRVRPAYQHYRRVPKRLRDIDTPEFYEL